MQFIWAAIAEVSINRGIAEEEWRKTGKSKFTEVVGVFEGVDVNGVIKTWAVSV